VRPIVHIGYHKTATTWFQRNVYPLATSHRWVPREATRQALLDPFGLSFDPAEARRKLTDPHDRRPVVICEENLSGYLHNGGLHGLMAPEAARRIKAVWPDARIVMLIRCQPAVIAASYVQYVRGGGTYGPRRYLFPGRYLTGAFRHPYKAPRFALEQFEYDRLIGFYDALFGPANVTVLPYEELRRDPEAFLARMGRELGLVIDQAAVAHRRANRSFGPLTILVARLLGLFTARSVIDKAYLFSIPGFYELRRPILNALSRLERPATPETILGSALVEQIRTHYGPSNRRLARLRDIDLQGLGYPLEPLEDLRGDLAEPRPKLTSTAPR
jgi:hypothetical protein